MRRVNEDSLSARLRRMRPEIVTALRERGEFRFREGGQEYTIRLRPTLSPPA